QPRPCGHGGRWRRPRGSRGKAHAHRACNFQRIRLRRRQREHHLSTLAMTDCLTETAPVEFRCCRLDTLPRWRPRLDGAKLGDRPPEGCLTAACRRPTMVAIAPAAAILSVACRGRARTKDGSNA